MSVLREIQKRKSITPEEQQIFDISNPQVFSLFGARASKSGIYVNEQSAMQLSAVYAAINLITKVFASTPLILYKDRGVGDKASGKDRAVDASLYEVLKNIAYSGNLVMPSFQWKECMMLSNLLNGNAYSYIHRNRRGECVALQYINHNYVQVDTSSGEKQYIISINSKQLTYSEYEILHVPGLSYDGVKGLSPLEAARETIGKGLALQDFANNFFSNGAKLTGVFEHPNALSDPAYVRLKGSLDEKSRTGGTLILEEGMKYSQIAIPPEQAQFLESMKFSVSDIARIYGVPPHMIGDLERATFSNIESQDINFVKYSMLPWFVRYEQFIWAKCLTDAQKERGYFVEALIDNLLRGDSKARASVFHLMRQDGVINADEWRERENMNPQPDEQGKEYLINGTMRPVKGIMNGGDENRNTGV